jgi:sugar-specific transcriptional regulator TrmB
MDTFELVNQAGLPKKEAAVYTALIEHGQQSLSSLHRITQINRPALYQVLPALERRNLVSRVKCKNRYQYVAESPRRLLEQYQTKTEYETKGLADLAEQYEHHDPERPTVKYFEGDKGVRFVFNDVINTLPTGGEFYRYSSRVNRSTKDFSNTLYARERDKRKIERLVITSEDKAAVKEPKLERAVRTIPKNFDLFEDNISLVMYGDKAAYIDYGSKTSFIIESKKIARFHQKLFKLLWKKLK